MTYWIINAGFLLAALVLFAIAWRAGGSSSEASRTSSRTGPVDAVPAGSDRAESGRAGSGGAESRGAEGARPTEAAGRGAVSGSRVRPRLRLSRSAALVTALVLLTLTAVFDNVMIGVGLVAYGEAQISGVMLGLMPVEDFSYTVFAVLALPALWTLLGRRKERRAADRAGSTAARSTATAAEHSPHHDSARGGHV